MSYSRDYVGNLKKQVVAQDMTAWNIREKYQLQLTRLMDIADIARIENDLFTVINCYKQILRKLVGQIPEDMRRNALNNLNQCLKIASQQDVDLSESDMQQMEQYNMSDINELLNEAEEIIYFAMYESKITVGNVSSRWQSKG